MSSVIPMLWVQDMVRSVRFYEDVMGFELQGEEPADRLDYASLQRGDVHLMLSKLGSTSFPGWRMMDAAADRRGTGGAVSFYIEAGDLAKEYARAQRAGGTIVDPISERPWGQSEFVVADPDGFWWAVWKQS
ncbi:MAG: VOC family protein [Dehalococcoidia bacterium]|nr:VOC family protein [Dehalococcoidia bacterium]